MYEEIAIDNLKNFLTFNEVAEILGLSHHKLINLDLTGKLVPFVDPKTKKRYYDPEKVEIVQKKIVSKRA